MKDEMVELGLHTEWAVFRDMWREKSIRIMEETLESGNLVM